MPPLSNIVAWSLGNRSSREVRPRYDSNVGNAKQL
jgi:hypothetical protein